MTFHRYTTPTYFGGLPVGYDLINVTSGGTGAGGSAFADNVKAGGPNVGTYFVAFGEDATSSNANRGMKALAQNCDALDDLLHRDLATPVRTVDVTPGAPVANVVLPTSTYLGLAGYTTSTADLNRLFEIVDDNDNEIIIQATGVKVAVTSVTLGAGDVIGGGGANGSFSGNTVQINISPSVPTGQKYRVYYGTRSNLATLPSDALTTMRIRGAQEVEAAVEDLFRQLHGNNEAWNAAWNSTIWDLGLSGFNERYRRATVANTQIPPESGFFPATTFDSPGTGAWINRDGPALTMYANNSGAYLDALNALFAAKFFDQAPATSGGTVGFAVYGARQSGSAWGGETLQHTPGAAAFMQLWPHYMTGGIHATNPRTRIQDFATATLANHGAYNANTGELVVTVTQAGNYFRDGGATSAIALGYDLLEITYTLAGTTTKRYQVIVAHGETGDLTNHAKVRIRNLDGTVWDITGASAFHIRWVSTTMAVGDGAGQLHYTLNGDAGPVLLDGLFYQVPPSLSSFNPDNDIPRSPPFFSAQDKTSATKAFQWGGFNYTNSAPEFAGYLSGDGGGVFGGGVTFNGTSDFYGVTGFNAGSTPHVKTTVTWTFDAGSMLAMLGRSRRVMRVALTDAPHTVDVTQGKRFTLPSPAAPRLITLDAITGTPLEGEWLEFIVPPGVAGGGTQYTFQRTGGTVICTFVGPTVATTSGTLFAEFEFAGGVWRLGRNSGVAWDGGGPPATFGVVPGAGA